jgi:hypothetical protein
MKATVVVQFSAARRGVGDGDGAPMPCGEAKPGRAPPPLPQPARTSAAAKTPAMPAMSAIANVMCDPTLCGAFMAFPP